MLNEARMNGNGHAEPVTAAWDARLARIERQIAEVAGASEQRALILHDALGDFCASELDKRDDEIRHLKEYVADLERQLEQKSAVDR